MVETVATLSDPSPVLPMTPAHVQDGYFYLLRRYLETIYSGCQAKEVNILVALVIISFLTMEY